MNFSGDCQISSVENCLPRICRGVEGVVGEVKSVSWGGAQTKGEVHKRELTNKMFLHSDLLTSLTSSLTPLFLRLKKLRIEQDFSEKSKRIPKRRLFGKVEEDAQETLI